jgi:hypothetical protein
MRPAETTARLVAFGGRGPGTDAERRAARWLAGELQTVGRDARLESFWCRPNWALAHAWHAALGLAGSLVSVSSPAIGGALVLVALLSAISDALTGRSPGRRLTFERASQNVVVAGAQSGAAPMHLILTANYDAGRTGLVYRTRLRAAAARVARFAPGPGWLGWFAIALVWVLVTAALRLGGAKGTAIGAAQLPPTVGLVLALAALVELGTARFGPAAGDNAAGAAVALAVADALAQAPLRNASVELVLQGAGEGGGIGLRRYLVAHRRALTPAHTVVLGIAPCGAGQLRWWVSDGQLVPLRYPARLGELCARTATAEPHFSARPHRGRGATPAFAGALVRRPAIAVGCLDIHGLAPRSHQPADTADSVDPDALDQTVQFALLIADEIDAFLARRQSRSDQPARQA